MTPLRDLALIVGATARMTRFFTSDTLGGWLVTDPAREWASAREAPSTQYTMEMDEFGRTQRVDHRDEFSPDHGWRSKLVSGLDCPACVGTWIGYAAIASYLVARRSPRLLGAWRFVAGGLSLNYAVFHVSSRID